jgi:hypothetical protein
MMESKWLACNDPDTLLQFVGQRASSRQLRLFACACCRRMWNLLTESAHRHAVETSERYADRQASHAELKAARAAAWEARSAVGVLEGPARAAAARGMLWEASRAAIDVRAAIGSWACRDVESREEEVRVFHVADTAERRAQSALLRDIVGNPFQVSPFDPAWLQWQGGTVVRIAQTIYDERRFADLPILADALEEAGCTQTAILDHCRKAAEHVRGCWVVDCILQER